MNKVVYELLSSQNNKFIRSIYLNGNYISTEIVKGEEVPLEVRRSLLVKNIGGNHE